MIVNGLYVEPLEILNCNRGQLLTLHPFFFQDNLGLAAVMIYHADNVPIDATDSFASVATLRESSMTVNFEDCSFMDNRASLGSVANFNGVVSLVRTVFIGNEGESGAVSIQNNGRLSMLDSCFVGNRGILGIVILNQGSFVVQNENSFGEANINDDLTCNDGLRVVSDSFPCMNVDLCQWNCSVFNATECAQLKVPSSVPSVLSPSLLPSVFMSIEPSYLSSGNTSLFPSYVPLLLDATTPSLRTDTRTVPCSLNVRLIGYDDSQSFLSDLALGVAERYLLCPGVSIVGDGLVVSTVKKLIIQCADSTVGCVWNATSHHLVVESSSGSSLTALLSGLTFRSASRSSINVQVNLKSTVDIRFSNCIWEGNTGETTVLISDPNAQTETIGGRALQSSTIAMFERCTFSGNQVMMSILVNIGGDLVLKNCTFQNNSAQESIVVSTLGSMVVGASIFDGNTFLGSRGLIFVGRDALLSLPTVESCQHDNFALYDISGISCEGTYRESTVICSAGDPRPPCQGTCLDMLTCSENPSFSPSSNAVSTGSESVMPTTILIRSLVPSYSPNPSMFENTNDTVSSDTPSFSPSFKPSYTPTLWPQPVTTEPSYIHPECYSDWKGLRRAIDDAGNKPDEEAILKLCANSFLDAVNEEDFTPIDIKGGFITIQCGDRESLEDNCTLFGGENHFKISNPTIQVGFTGLTFIAAQKLSIFGAANSSASATFESCRWTVRWNNCFSEHLSLSHPYQSLLLIAKQWNRCHFIV